jgi:hypothetical protein
MITKASKERKANQNGKAAVRNNEIPPEVRTYVNRVLFGSLSLAVVLPLGALAIYCAGLPSDSWSAFGSAFMVSTACCFAGGLLGFIFGIPRALSGDAELTSDKQRGRLNANTNLEEISDWLTKIIVGATLVQLGSLARHFSTLATSVSSIFGTPSEQNRIMAGSVILYSSILGFLASYIAARSIITFLLNIRPSDWISERQETQSSSDTEKSKLEHSNPAGSDIL